MRERFESGQAQCPHFRYSGRRALSLSVSRAKRCRFVAASCGADERAKVLCQGFGKERWHGVTDVALLVGFVAVEDEAIVERLKPCRLSHGDGALVAVVGKAPRTGIAEVGRDGEPNPLRMKPRIGLAEVIVGEPFTVGQVGV